MRLVILWNSNQICGGLIIEWLQPLIDISLTLKDCWRVVLERHYSIQPNGSQIISRRSVVFLFFGFKLFLHSRTIFYRGFDTIGLSIIIEPELISINDYRIYIAYIVIVPVLSTYVPAATGRNFVLRQYVAIGINSPVTKSLPCKTI